MATKKTTPPAEKIGPLKSQRIIAREQRFSAQCFLMHHLGLSKIYTANKSYKYFTCVDSDPSAFL